MLVTVARYQAITGDAHTAAQTVTARIEQATDELEDILGRPLAHDERTESLRPTRDGRLWPKATPITDGGDYTVDGYSLRAWPAFHDWGFVGSDDGLVEVTYSGGYVERSENPDAANRLPSCIERDIAWAAWRLGQAADTTAASIPAHASSVRLGDAAVTMSEGATIPTLGSQSGWWSKRTLSYRYARRGTEDPSWC